MVNTLIKSYGKVEKIVYYNAQNKWGVISVTNNTNEFSDTKVLLSGNFEGVYENCEIEYEGNIQVHPKYGKQIVLSSIVVKQDLTSKESIVNFLSKSAIKGIDVQNALKIYNAYKDKSIDVVLNKTDEIINIKGIGKETLNKVKDSVVNYKRMEGLIQYCTELGISYNTIYRLDNELGEKALEYLKGNIYNILSVDDCTLTFNQVDAIAIRKDKNNLNSVERGKACLIYLLKTISKVSSSTGVALPVLKDNFFKQMGVLDNRIFTVSLNNLINSNTVLLERNIVYLKEYYELEKGIAQIVNDMCNRPIVKKLFKKSVVEEEIHNFTFELNDQQKNAIKNSLVKPVSVLTGPPGCGKSTVTKALCNIYHRSDFNVVLLAPTGKATRRLAECTGRDALTIHKYLINLKMKNESIPTKTVVIIDESSMIDIIIFSELLSKLNNDTRIILVGDIDQLPSVQIGNVLSDIVYSKKVNICRLTDIMRQQEDSLIIKNCSLINNGKNINSCNRDDFFYKEYEDENVLKEDFMSQYIEEVYLKGLDNVQVICPYKKGKLGVNLINRDISDVTNEEDINNTFGYKLGDKVMQLHNDYKKEVFNGETGIVDSFSEDTMYVSFDGAIKSYQVEELHNLQLAYAGTVHKMQGSEYPVVFILLGNDNPMLMVRKILYTAVSRGKKKVYIYSMKDAVKMCIKNDNEEPRITKLREMIAEY